MNVGEIEKGDACMRGRPVLPDAPIVIVHAAAWFIIHLFIILLVQIANKMGLQKKIYIFVVISADGRKLHRS
jgi:hypothetical protein